MWAEVLPADETEEVFFFELPDDTDRAWEQIGAIIGGDPKVINNKTLTEKFGNGPVYTVMIINAGRVRTGKVNKKATQYAPNEYDIKVRGDAILIGWSMQGTEEGLGYNITSMPAKWKTIYDMETVYADDEVDLRTTHRRLDELLLSAADPDVAKMYREALEDLQWHTN